ncbi:hypothetical protein Nepgr_006465 [Nepenthes gracilis]|uniref:Uncharacterized protein n=1 Tax=Nepenthes gracilis TaxID=150966 RepID=A0AAD3S5J0_NEPGR|nr:hypothetical protein Nepgr_006465 [Nepenthes gracilis]
MRSVPVDSSAGVDSGTDMHFSPDKDVPTGSFRKGSSVEACDDAPSNAELCTICSTGFFGHDASADAWSVGVGCGLEPVMLVWAGIDDERWAGIDDGRWSDTCYPRLVACYLFYGAGLLIVACLSRGCWVAECKLLAAVVQKYKVISDDFAGADFGKVLLEPLECCSR